MTIHKAVLLKETVENLNLKKGDVVVDATLGAGGHSREILKIIGEKGKLIAIDRDREAIDNFLRSERKSSFSVLSNYPFPVFKSDNFYLVNSNFSDLASILENLKIKKVNAVLADFGISSDQIENKKRGFSFSFPDAFLDMRMDERQILTAADLLNRLEERELKKILHRRADEKYAGPIAREIVRKRKKKRIETVGELVAIIETVVPNNYRRHKIHPATKTFQALRMEVNRETENIEKFLPQALDILKKEGRLALLSFHSGEDRLVKNFFRENARGCVCPKEFPVCQCGLSARIKIITKKPIRPSLEEMNKNPRARSACLRVAEKI